MRILFTGASSFTGSAMASALAHAGHEVTAVFTRKSPADYEGIRLTRVQRLLPQVCPLWQACFGGPVFLQALEESGPWDVLCHHAAEVRDYKSPQFDWQRAVTANTHNLEAVLDLFRRRGGTAVVLTGTYFEADEGAGTAPLAAVSPYGLSKTLTWQVFRFVCEQQGILPAKYVLPNPIGSGEEPRFVSYMVECWKRGEAAQVRQPNLVRDNLPVDLLASDYVAFVNRVSRADPADGIVQRNPSGWVETMVQFSQRVAAEFGAIAGRSFAVETSPAGAANEPQIRHNTDTCLNGWTREAQDRFWREWAAYYSF